MKIKLIFASTAALALVAGAPAWAAKSQNQEAVESDGAGAGSKPKNERKICRTFDKTETRMKREKLCLTREQWKEFERTQTE